MAIDLHHSRWRNLGWGAASLLVGGFLVVRLGTFGLVVGLPLVLVGLHAGRNFVRTLLHPPGVIVVGDDDVELPPRLCAANPVKVPFADIRHAYLLRKAVPLSTSGPLLVVETRRGVFEYPRDWFVGEKDQERVTLVLNRRLGKID